MDGFHVATAYITVLPDTAGFEEELRAKLEADNYRLAIPIVPDTDGFREKLAAELEAMPDAEVRITPADIPEFLEKIRAAVAAASDSEDVQIPITPADIPGFEGKIRAAVAAANDGDGVQIPVDADLSDASLAAAEEKARIFVSDSGGVTLPVYADAQPVSFERVRAAAQLLADAQPVKLPVEMNTAGALAGVTGLTAATDALGASTGRAYGLWGLLGKGIPLFSGMGVAGIMKSVAAWHLLADVAVEFGAVAIPALIATGAFGLAAAGDVGDMYTHFQNVLTVTDAMRENMPPLTGGLTAMQNAVKPEVYQLAGEAIGAMSQKAGVFTQLATQTGTVLDQLGARAEVAFTSSGMTTFLRNATGDLKVLGTTAGNVFGIFGNLLKSMPGYAQILSQVIEHATGALEDITSSGVAQGAIKAGLAFHGAAIYVGLAATAFGALARGGLTMAGNLLGKASVAAGKLGEAGEGASAGLARLSAQAGAAATLPWAWIAVAAAGVAFLAYKFVDAGDAADDFASRINAAVAAAPLTQTLATINDGLAQTRERLSGAGDQMGHLSGLTGLMGHALQSVAPGLSDINTGLTRFVHDIPGEGLILDALGGSLIRTSSSMKGTGEAAATAVHDYQTYRAEITSLQQQSVTFGTHLDILAVAFGGTAQAMGILTAAGITSAQMTSKSASSWAQVLAQVQATTVAYQDMGQTGGVLGADMNALDIAASEQATAMSKVNQAWDSTIGIVSGGQNAFITFQQDLLSVNQAVAGTGGTTRVVTDTFAAAEKAAKTAGASMTGLNASSLQLRGTWQSAYGGASTLIDSLRMMSSISPGGFPSVTRAMKDSIAELIPFGAQSAATRSELVELAQEIDPNITSFSQLTKWIGSTKNASADLNKLVAQMGGNLQDLAKDAGSLSASMQSDVSAQFDKAKLASSGAMTAITNLGTALGKAGGTARNTVPDQDALYAALRRSGMQAGAAQTMIEAMTGAIFKIPKSHTTDINANTSQARSAISQVQDWIGSLHGKTVNINVAIATSGSVPSSIGLGVRTGATGGVLPGYAPGQDTVPALLSPGEGVLVPEAVKALSPAFVHAMNARYAPHRVSGAGKFAAGGITETAKFGYPNDVFNISMTTQAASAPGVKINYGSLAGELLGTGGGYGKFAAQYDASQKATLEKDMRDAGIKLADAFADGSLKTVTEIKDESLTAIQTLQKYYSGPAATRLENAIKRQTTAMEKLSTASSKVSTTIANMKSAAAAEVSSLQSFSNLSNITGTTNSATGVTAPVTGAQIKSGLATDLAQLRKFFDVIGSLKRQGVDATLINQVIALGPVDGITYGEAILSGGKTLISELNAEEKAIGSEETAIGQRSADIQYGQNISKGFLSGLDKDQAALKKRMDALGQEIAKELAKALGVPLKDITGLPEHKKKTEPKGGGSSGGTKPEPKHDPKHKAGPPVMHPGAVTINLHGSKGKLTHEEAAGLAHELGKQLALAT
jgi:hypothetical protein